VSTDIRAVCGLQYFTMALTKVCATPCSSNCGSDLSSIPPVGRYRYGLHAAMLVNSFHDGLRATMLVDSFHDGLRAALVVQ